MPVRKSIVSRHAVNTYTRPDETTRQAGPHLMVVVLLCLFSLTPAALAHEGSRIRLELAKVPAELQGVRIEVHETIAPQMVIENSTGKLLEILDGAGVAFLRIGPAGVEGNLAASAWYLTDNPVATAPRSVQQAGADSRWKLLSANPFWGWFDLRLRKDSITLPHLIVDRGLAAEIGKWEIPVRLGGVATAIRGTFRYEPPPRFVFLSQLTSATELAAGVYVTLVPGTVPALFLQNKSGQTVTVFGRANEPFLRVGSEGVQANASSPSWQESMRFSGRVSERLDENSALQKWETLSASSSYAWIEPRALHPEHESSAISSAKEFRWEVPIQIGDKRFLISGVTVLKPVFRAELQATNVNAGKETTLTLTVRDARDLTVRDLAIVHEKPMHLLIVSNDLAEFYHLHPELQRDGLE